MALITRRSFGPCALAAIVLALTAGSADAQQKLIWKFKKGEKLNYEMVQNADVSGLGGDMKVKQVLDMTWNVTDVLSDGSAAITLKISRLRMTLSGGLIGNVEYDSAKSAAGNPLATQLGNSVGGIVNVGFDYTFTPSGRIKDMKLSDRAKAALKKAGGRAGAAGFGGFNSGAIKQMAGQMGAVFPTTGVSKGRPWNIEVSSQSPFGQTKSKSTFKLAGIESRSGLTVAKIESTTKTSIDSKPGAPAKVTVNDKGGKGTAFFDISRGRVVSSTFKQEMEMSAAIGGQAFRMSVKRSVAIKLRK